MLDLCGRRGTFSTCIDVHRSLATKGGPWTPTAFYVAGATLSAPQARFAWQAWHVQYLHRRLRKLGDERVPMDAAAVCVTGVTLSGCQAVCMYVCM